MPGSINTLKQLVLKPTARQLVDEDLKLLEELNQHIARGEGLVE